MEDSDLEVFDIVCPECLCNLFDFTHPDGSVRKYPPDEVDSETTLVCDNCKRKSKLGDLYKIPQTSN